MITFTADGKDYKLEVTAFTLKQMEKSGVNFAQLGEKLLGAETLWKGLFIAHHGTVTDAKRMEITCGEGGAFTIRRTSGDAWAQLDANLADHTYEVTHS